jgi:hypothetical protein
MKDSVKSVAAAISFIVKPRERRMWRSFEPRELAALASGNNGAGIVTRLLS